MKEKIEGTVILDGLIEGRVPSDPDAERHLREWIDLARSMKLRFNLETDAGSFSLLADNSAVRAADLERGPAATVSELLTQLLTIFSPDEKPRVYSTLNSVEYGKGMETQTLYSIAPDGTVNMDYWEDNPTDDALEEWEENARWAI